MKPAGGAKFGGILRGRILEKDVEAGRFNLEITASTPSSGTASPRANI